MQFYLDCLLLLGKIQNHGNRERTGDLPDQLVGDVCDGGHYDGMLESNGLKKGSRSNYDGLEPSKCAMR
jgi:hypothetical protein